MYLRETVALLLVCDVEENDHGAMGIEGENWPLEADFEKIRPLGKGAFGIVWLAKSRDKNATANNVADAEESEEKDDMFDSAINHPTYVAIKQIHASSEEEAEYAQREIDILSEINHPNIIRCLQSVKLKNTWHVVLSLANGPNLGDLINAGGALSVSLARLAARHLIAAVSYLHVRGVIHRDLKPDNCILMKTDDSLIQHQTKEDWMSNDKLWDDKADFSEGWKIILVDFGFAKSLSPEQVGIGLSSKRPSVRNFVQKAIEENGGNAANNSKHGKNKPVKRNASFQKLHRYMSAIGTREFAAPEVQKANEKSKADKVLSNCVADYGLVADAYSVGATIRMILTGVPAGESEMAFISANESVIGTILDTICGCRKKDDGKRKKRYKFLDETPKPARELVENMMKRKEEERLTVPSAREESWIIGGVDSNDPVIELPAGDLPAGNDDPIACLKCAEKHRF